MKFMTMLTVPAFFLVLCALPLRSIGKPNPDDNMARIGLMADTSMPSRLGSVSFNISCKPAPACKSPSLQGLSDPEAPEAGGLPAQEGGPPVVRSPLRALPRRRPGRPVQPRSWRVTW